MNARAVIVVGAAGAIGAAVWLARRQPAAPAAVGNPTPATEPDSSFGWLPPAVSEVIEGVENTVATLTLPRGLRNHNPGNLRPGSQWLGLANPSTDGQNYLRFTTPHYGLRAAAINLKNQQAKHGLKTVRAIINKYAPPVENNTSAYVTAVAKRLGVSPDAAINLLDRATLELFLRAVVSHENGRGDYYDDGAYALAVDAAL